MKQIKLTKGKFALVDDADYEWLNQWKWYASKNKNTYYAKREKDGKNIKMHRLILGLVDPKIQGDHKDGDGLNNQRNNLRPCTNAQNQMNARSRKGSTSKFLGVNWFKRDNKWQSEIKAHGRRIYLGRFETELEAAIIYNIAARKYYGEFANPNKFI